MRLSFQAPQAEAAEEQPFASVQTGLKGAAVVVDGVLRALKVSHVHPATAVVLRESTRGGQS